MAPRLLAVFALPVLAALPSMAEAAPSRGDVLALVCTGRFAEAAATIDGLPADARDPLIDLARVWLHAAEGEAGKARMLATRLRERPVGGRLVDACSGASVATPFAELVDLSARKPSAVPTVDDPQTSDRPLGPPPAPQPPPSPPAVAQKPAAMRPAPLVEPAKSPALSVASPAAPPTTSTTTSPGTPAAPQPAKLQPAAAAPPKAADAPPPASPPGAAPKALVQLGVVRARSSVGPIVGAARGALPDLPPADQVRVEPVRGQELFRVLMPVADPAATCRALAEKRIPCVVEPPRRGK